MTEITKERVEAAAWYHCPHIGVQAGPNTVCAAPCGTCRHKAQSALTAALALPRKDGDASSQLSGRSSNEALDRCQQIAGKALRYPWYKDDQKNFPGATEADGVCIGDHVEETIVEELAKAYLARKDGAACAVCGTINPNLVDVCYHANCPANGPGVSPGLCTWPKCDCAEIGRELCSRRGEPAPVDRFHNPQSKDRHCVEVVAPDPPIFCKACGSQVPGAHYATCPMMLSAPTSPAPGGESGEALISQAEHDFLIRDGWFAVEHQKYDASARALIHGLLNIIDRQIATLSRSQPVEGVRKLFEQIVTVCDDNAKAERPDFALKFVRDVAARALLASPLPAPQSTGERADGWRPIETAPKDGTAFVAVNANAADVSLRVVYFDDEAVDDLVWHVEDAGKGFNHHRDFFTHWRPRPAPPRPQDDAVVKMWRELGVPCAQVADGDF